MYCLRISSSGRKRTHWIFSTVERLMLFSISFVFFVWNRIFMVFRDGEIWAVTGPKYRSQHHITLWNVAHLGHIINITYRQVDDNRLENRQSHENIMFILVEFFFWMRLQNMRTISGIELKFEPKNVHQSNHFGIFAALTHMVLESMFAVIWCSTHQKQQHSVLRKWFFFNMLQLLLHVCLKHWTWISK